MTANLTNTADTIDLRDVIARVEELEAEQPLVSDDDLAELDMLKRLLEECKGNGGDEEWDGDWYPVTLIRESYFTEYAQELAEDIGAVDAKATWPNNCIDWDHAACELMMDYTGIEFDGVTYYCR